MAANTYAVMDALAKDSEVHGSLGFFGPLDPFMYNPHESWHDALRDNNDEPPSEIDDMPLAYAGQYKSTPLGNLYRVLKQEKQQLGINVDTGDWTTSSGPTIGCTPTARTSTP